MKKLKKKNMDKNFKLSKQALEIKKTDLEFYLTKLISYCEIDKNTWEINTELGCTLCPKIKNFTPELGMIVRFYGKGFGYTLRGIEIDDKISYYRTPKQEERRFKKWCNDRDNEKKNQFKKNKKKLDKDYNSLPDVFKKRIDKFRKNNLNFRWKYEEYEMFCCKEAVKISNSLKTKEEIEKWKNLSYKDQKRFVDISDGHSGNTFSCSVYLASIYVSKNSKNVIKQHGALAPLVGSEEYGCIPKK